MKSARLARLLTYRRRREEQLQRELTQLHRQYREQEARLSTLTAAQQDQEDALARAQNQAFTGSELRMRVAYYRHLAQQRMAHHTIVVETGTAMACKREEVLAAYQQRVLLEKLYAKRLWHERQEYAKRERAFLDELAQRRIRHES